MNQTWIKSVIPIAALFSFRMLGLFMLLPVFSIAATNLDSSTPFLIGIALGAYGLTQGALQIPFGWLSDRFGRKPMLLIGFILFIIGSVIGSLTHSIYGMILARFIQGAGAIGSVLIALLADLTSIEQRTKAMAVIGASIGLSFSLAIIISPPLTRAYGLSGIFSLTVVLALLGMLIVCWVVPKPSAESTQCKEDVPHQLFSQALLNKNLQRLNLSIFCQHFIFTATFFAFPILLKQHLEQTWKFYLPVMFFSFISMIPIIIITEKKKLVKATLLVTVFLTTLCQAFLAVTDSNWFFIVVLMFLYFVAFNYLEATLPSLVSKLIASNAKGTAMGIYSSSQFLGIFSGGALAGAIYALFGNQGIFLMNAAMGIIWWYITSSIKKVR